MDIKVVLHVDSDMEERLAMALNNITNLLKEVSHENASIYLLINGPAVKLLRNNRMYADKFKELSIKGVQFLVCNNSLAKTGIDRDELPDCCEVVPAGILELIRLQNKGCAYVKP
jgi:intracellular sulfur oxidation DsrE/DsrF family protein